MAKRFAFFYGKWTKHERRCIQEAALWKEMRADLPPRALGEPWVIVRQDLGEGCTCLAHRSGWPEPVSGSTPEELAAAIRAR